MKEVIKAADTGLPGAIVTNPTVIADWTANGNTLEEVVREVCEATDLPLYIQLRGPDVDQLKSQGDALAAISPQVCLKLPATLAGMEATAYFSKAGRTTLVTTICSMEQAYLAACAGADAICPYMSRLDDAGGSSIRLIADISELYSCNGCETRIFPASVRTCQQIGEAMRAGAHGVIIFDNLFREMTGHPVTESSLAAFESDDWSRIPSGPPAGKGIH
jgi:transaldolase